MNVYMIATQIIPYLGLISMLVLFAFQQKNLGIRSFLITTGIALMASILGLILDHVGQDQLNFLLSSLILFVSLNIQQYSKRYFDGDNRAHWYFLKLAVLSVSANSLVLVDSPLRFAIFWIINNITLVGLMIHQPQWKAQKNAGILSLLSLSIGAVALIIGFYMLYTLPQSYQLTAKLLLIFAAICQSAIWPMHRWLLSSLNSPTPVSALMHAGIVNGGGILLIKYHALFIHDLHLMHLIFIMGFITAILGGFWKLMQTDIKKMLANSTMGQMGFMFMQCGLGLFPAAIAHICWHGLFKAYLFLNSGTALQAKASCPKLQFKPIRYVYIVLATLLAVLSFSYSANIELTSFNTYWFMMGIVAISAWQLSYGLVGKNHALLDIFLVAIFSAIYGLSIRFIESCFSDGKELALNLDPLFILGFAGLFFIWLVFNSPLFSKLKKTRFWQWFYITSLNLSAAKSNCISAIRNDIKA